MGIKVFAPGTHKNWPKTIFHDFSGPAGRPFGRQNRLFEVSFRMSFFKSFSEAFLEGFWRFSGGADVAETM